MMAARHPLTGSHASPVPPLASPITAPLAKPIADAIPAFAAYGIELEYMIVDRASLAVRPIAAELLDALGAGEARGNAAERLGWSNELVRHVVEVKNVEPTATLARLPARFQRAIRAANRLLEGHGARLMPTAMHPWMDPLAETSLWDDEIYRTYDRIYGCRGHGWANLQSMHVNLPFADDAEFARLHAAIRLVLPLLPAIAASSPIAEGAPSGLLDFRLDAYRRICAITPTVSGRVIPETVETRAEYEARILVPMYEEIAPHDPAGSLTHEWLNSRGAIARFDRNAIEIRVIDVQECPQADAAIAGVTAAVVKALYDERFAPLDEQQAVGTEVLESVLLATIRDGEQAVVAHRPLLHALGIPDMRCSAREAWHALVDAVDGTSTWWRPPLDTILREGPLARRILRAVGPRTDPRRLYAVYEDLCECLEEGRLFE
jgi:gamma-glutamyl:cysteine ligase YbdK (ATP-grasp superfamily)